jgi:hypothetical protein
MEMGTKDQWHRHSNSGSIPFGDVTAGADHLLPHAQVIPNGADGGFSGGGGSRWARGRGFAAQRFRFTGIPTPAYPGALISNHALNGTPEFAYGVTPWLELGLYVPWAVNGEGQFLSNNIKLRTLFAIPDAAKKDFFYGLNFEYDFPSWPFVPSRSAMEVRPIIGWRNPQWEFIINPIIDFAWGQLGEVDFAPAARLARNLGEDRFIGLEYYTGLGTPGNFQSFQQQSVPQLSLAHAVPALL